MVKIANTLKRAERALEYQSERRKERKEWLRKRGYIRETNAEWDARRKERWRQAMLEASVMRTRVYFVAAGAEAIKIGFTDNIYARMIALQIGNHLPLKLLGCRPGNELDEENTHKQFAKDRLQGEWFYPSDELLDYIDAYCPSGPATKLFVTKTKTPMVMDSITRTVVSLFDEPYQAVEYQKQYNGQPYFTLPMSFIGLDVEKYA